MNFKRIFFMILCLSCAYNQALHIPLFSPLKAIITRTTPIIFRHLQRHSFGYCTLAGLGLVGCTFAWHTYCMKKLKNSFEKRLKDQADDVTQVRSQCLQNVKYIESVNTKIDLGSTRTSQNDEVNQLKQQISSFEQQLSILTQSMQKFAGPQQNCTPEQYESIMQNIESLRCEIQYLKNSSATSSTKPSSSSSPKKQSSGGLWNKLFGPYSEHNDATQEPRLAGVVIKG